MIVVWEIMKEIGKLNNDNKIINICVFKVNSDKCDEFDEANIITI